MPIHAGRELGVSVTISVSPSEIAAVTSSTVDASTVRATRADMLGQDAWHGSRAGAGTQKKSKSHHGTVRARRASCGRVKALTGESKV